MGLDNYPTKCRCGKHRYSRRLKDWVTHLEDKPCPFAADEFPVGMMGTCCSLRGKIAAYNLEALGEDELAGRMYEEMTAEEAGAFAQRLAAAADRLKRQYAGAKEKPGGKDGVMGIDLDTKQVIPGEPVPIEEAVASIREAARWYFKVYDLGFGVDTWA